MLCWVECTADEAGNEWAVCCADLVAACWESLADEDVDWGLDAREDWWDVDCVDLSVAACLDVVVP